MVDDIVIGLENFLSLLSLLVFGICLEKLVFKSKENEKSENVITLVLMASLYLTIITIPTLDILAVRVVSGFLLFFILVFVLAKEIRQSDKK